MYISSIVATETTESKYCHVLGSFEHPCQLCYFVFCLSYRHIRNKFDIIKSCKSTLPNKAKILCLIDKLHDTWNAWDKIVQVDFLCCLSVQLSHAEKTLREHFSNIVLSATNVFKVSKKLK